MNTSYTRSIIVGAAIGLGFSLFFAAGFFVRDWVGQSPVRAFNFTADPNTEGYPLLDEVQGLVDKVYLREQPAYDQRQYAAIRGMLSSLSDPNTFFIDPPVAQSEADALAGTYGGIGVQLRRDEMGQFVLYPFPDGPAAAAGIEDGDALIAIDDAPIAVTQQHDAVDQMMRGEVTSGNGVKVTVRKDDDTEFSVFIEFAVINVPSVVWRVLDEDARIGYVQIIRFTNRTPEELRMALTDLNDATIEALILDLRNNSGGLLSESVSVASEFLDGGVVIYEESQDDTRTYEAEPGGLWTQSPLVVLVNNRTASASELVAGAIRDRERGILIGQQTFGKGTVQQIFPLSDGSSVHITSAEWFTPARVPLDGTGLEPTIAMIPDVNGRDVETGEAVRYLQQTLANDNAAAYSTGYNELDAQAS